MVLVSATLVTLGAVLRLYSPLVAVRYLIVPFVGAVTLVIAQLCGFVSYVQLFAPQPAAVFAQSTALVSI